MPRWIVLDAVGTILEPQPSVAEAYWEIGSQFGPVPNVSTIRTRFRTAFRLSEQVCFPPSRIGCTSEAEELARWRWIVGEVLGELPAAAYEPAFQALWEHFGRPESWRLFADVPDALADFRERGWNVAIASNFDQRLHTVCTGFPELHPITHRFVSSAVGFRKPAPQFYTTVAERLGCAPSALWMIGDDPVCDGDGPRQAGWQAVLLDRSAKFAASAGDVQPIPTVNRLGAVVEWLTDR